MPEITAEEIMVDAMFEIGALALGQTMSATEEALCLRYLNRLIDSSEILKNAVYAATMDQYPTVAGKKSYTIGKDPDTLATADFDGMRPNDIRSIVVQLPGASVRRTPPLRPLSEKEYAAIQQPDIEGIPEGYYYDNKYPLASLYFHPVPDAVYQVEIWHSLVSGKLTSKADKISFPDEYKDYFLYNLAMRLCGPLQRPLPDSLIAMTKMINDGLALKNSTAKSAEEPPDTAQSAWMKSADQQGNPIWIPIKR